VSDGAVLALDPGSVRVGIAASDPTRTIATPIAAVARDPAVLWPFVQRQIDERAITEVVIGLPRNLDGSDGAAAVDARTLAAETRRRTHLPVTLWDERFTTVQAERELIAAGVRRRTRRERVDAAAAALLLQSWLESSARLADRG